MAVRAWRLWYATMAGAAALASIVPARAVTLTSLKDAQVAWGYGHYAPAGKCAGPVRIAVDASGFTFTVNGQTAHPARFENALDFVRGADPAQVAWFFPFPRSDDDFGPILLTVTRTPATITVDNETGRPLAGMHGALVAASPFRKCAGAVPVEKAPAVAPAPTSRPVVPAADPAGAGPGLSWAGLPRAAASGRYGVPDGEVGAAIKALIGAKWPVLTNNLSVSSPLARAGSVYWLSGNADHRGGYDMAYVALDAGTRAIEVGLWEGGKLTFYRSAGKRVVLPAAIVRLRTEQPPEQAVAAPGPPWEVRALPGGGSLAFGTPAASPHVDTIGLYCEKGRPVFNALLYRDPGKATMTFSFAFAGGLVNIPMTAVNGTRTYWLAYVDRLPLIHMLATQRDTAYLRLDQAGEGEVSLAAAGPVLRKALARCYRF
jgi:hypothetical protein